MTLAFQSASATSYYVELTGNDANSGLDGAPWRTLTKACNTVEADQGHTIQIGEGTFTEPDILTLKSGVSLIGAGSGKTRILVNHYFSLTDAVPNANPHRNTFPEHFILQMNGSNQVIRGFSLDGQDKRCHGGIFAPFTREVTFEDLHVMNFRYSGLWVIEANDTIVRFNRFKNNTYGNPQKAGEGGGDSGAVQYHRGKNLIIHDNHIVETGNLGPNYGGYGMKAQDRNYSVSASNVLEGFRMYNNVITVPSNGAWEKGIAPAFAAEFLGMALKDCEIYNNLLNNTLSLAGPAGSGEGIRIHHNFINIGKGRYGYGIEANVSNVEIDHNYFCGGLHPIAVFGRNPRNHNIHHNIFEGTCAGAFANRNLLHYKVPVTNLRFTHNTVIDNGSIGQLFALQEATTYEIRNNLFIRPGDHKDIWGPDVPGMISHNFFVNITPRGKNAMTGDAGITLVGDSPLRPPYYTFNPDSPLLDKGEIISPLTDGFTGSAPDIGAIEDGVALAIPLALKVSDDKEIAVPYRDALEQAAISVPSLDGILENGLLLGNGDINGLLYSEKGQIVLRVTKNDVWDARVLTENDPPLPTLKRLKELGASGQWGGKGGGDWILPEGVLPPKADSYGANAFPCPRACAVVRLGTRAENPIESPGNIDIARAAVRTGAITLRALGQSNVFLIDSPEPARLEAIVPGDIPAAETGQRSGVQWVKQVIPGDPDWPGMSFAVALAQDGARKTLAVVTSREAADPVAAAVKLAGDTLLADAAATICRHEEIWADFWSRSGVRLADDFLTQTWYRNLYFFRCVTKSGVISPGLYAGLTTDRPKWHGDYHTNYNLQQTFWTAYNTNHPELAEPYDRLMHEYLPRAQWLAKTVFDLDGAYYPHVLYAYEPPHPDQCKSRNGRQYIQHVWGMTLGVTGFTVQPLWWHYKYAPDRERLEKTVYPAIREAALFYANFADQCDRRPNGRILLGPTVSPEHHGWTPNFARNYDCTFDIAMVRYTLNAAIEGAGILGRDAPLIARWKQTLSVLPDYPILGGKAPVVVDVATAHPITYNITVPTTPVFPGDVVTWWSPEKEKELFARTLSGVLWNGYNSIYIVGVGRARLSMPGTMEWLRAELQARMRPNQLITSNRLGDRFNDFGHYTEQFAASMAIGELLLQSVGDIIRVFPAWPADKDASFTTLRAQGGFLVSAEQKSGKVSHIEITSTVEGTLRLLDPWTCKIVEREMKAGEKLAMKP